MYNSDPLDVFTFILTFTKCADATCASNGSCIRTLIVVRNAVGTIVRSMRGCQLGVRYHVMTNAPTLRIHMRVEVGNGCYERLLFRLTAVVFSARSSLGSKNAARPNAQ